MKREEEAIERGTIINGWSGGQRGRGVDRYYVVISDAADHGLKGPLVCLGISTQIAEPPGEEAVMLPYHPNPKMRPGTGLARRCGVIVDWAVAVEQADVNNRAVGRVSAKLMREIFKKVAERQERGGGKA